MDFRRNNSAPISQSERPTTQPTVTQPSSRIADKSGLTMPSWLSILNMLALVAVVVLLLAGALAVTRGRSNTESASVKTNEYQAVFLNNGQVYFGNITDINSQVVNLKNVFYLTQSTTTSGQASSDYTLVKLGCQQIHYPEDQMVISRAQVTFWENLNKSGKVATSIAQFKQQNPNGPNCSAQTSQTPAANTPSQASSNSATQVTPTTKK